MSIVKEIHLEFHEGNSDKEYRMNIQTNGDAYDIYVAYGRRGAVSNVYKFNAKPCPTLAIAERMFDKQISSKLHKGYTLTTSAVTDMI